MIRVTLGLLFIISLLFSPPVYADNVSFVTNETSNTQASYWIANPQGEVWNFGKAKDYGDLSDIKLNKPIVGITPTISSNGYWLVATDGGIFSFGDAQFYGSTGNIKLNKPIVGIAPTLSGKGYFLVASDGGIFAFGDAQFYGSTGNIKLNKPIVAMTSTPSGNGYWLVATDGGIFAFGDAQFYGSTGNISLNKPIISMAVMPSNKGYWMVASDGGIFAFGNAQFYGSAGAGQGDTYAKILPAADSKGYWLIANGGDVIGYGSVKTDGALSKARPAIGLIHNITGPGDLAMQTSLRQLGKPYIWGGTGPDGYDCSGLTLRAWQSGGVTIPRVAADQYNFGKRIALNSLIPGDLIYWADDVNNPATINHVALYVGGGNVVTAPRTGQTVRTQQIWTTGLMGFATRPR